MICFFARSVEFLMTTNRILATVLVLQVVMILNQWLGSPINSAQAQIPDAGAQRDEMINQLKATNDTLKGIDDKLDKMEGVFASGKLQVVVAKPDENEGK
jgi:hypothetical protein